jgi:hypothetical protein
MIVASRWWLEERVGVSAGTPTNDVLGEFHRMRMPPIDERSLEKENAEVQLYHFT